MLIKLYRLFNMPHFDANGGAGGGGDGGGAGGDGGNGGGNGNGGQGNAGGGKTFSQEDVDAIIAKRLARAEKDFATKMEEERKKASLSETEKLKAEKEEADKKGKAAIEAANQRLVTAEAKVQAAALGVHPDKITHVLKLADLSGADVNDKGEVNVKVVKQAIEAVLKDLPELKAGGQGGANLGGNPNFKGTARDMNSFIRRAAGR
ncbi:hypothetical protein [Anaeroselena agilis]|uniref:DUF4355 domain-containing protein n=1 Tax=Anaeroselena agilis TaxID=3063788 RepID=A0ABU3NZ73_9FIRM|nr:DUF4355 domain-containing protein [Selenomonadales bacterium 4137-cl]